MALSSIQDPPDASTIVGYILVIPTPGGKPPDTGLTVLLTGQECMGPEIQESKIHGYKISGNSVIVMSRSHEGARCTVN